MKSESKPKNKINLNVKLDLRWIVLFLSLLIIGMLAIWKPWIGDTTDNNRTVSVTGKASMSAEPDEYVFYPSYEFKNNTDRQIAINEANAKSAEIITQLKALGVTDNKIKSSVSGYPDYYYSETDNTYNYTLSLTIKISDLELAQKVQDYLNSTAPQGNVSPVAGFSDAKQKTLENQARDEATQDAKNKADRMANNLGFKLGKIKSVTDGSGFGIIEPMYATDGIKTGDISTSSTGSNTIQPGENELNYSVTVIYYLK